MAQPVHHWNHFCAKSVVGKGEAGHSQDGPRQRKKVRVCEREKGRERNDRDGDKGYEDERALKDWTG